MNPAVVGSTVTLSLSPSVTLTSGNWAVEETFILTWLGEQQAVFPGYSGRAFVNVTSGALTLSALTVTDSGLYQVQSGDPLLKASVSLTVVGENMLEVFTFYDSPFICLYVNCLYLNHPRWYNKYFITMHWGEKVLGNFRWNKFLLLWKLIPANSSERNGVYRNSCFCFVIFTCCHKLAHAQVSWWWDCALWLVSVSALTLSLCVSVLLNLYFHRSCQRISNKRKTVRAWISEWGKKIYALQNFTVIFQLKIISCYGIFTKISLGWKCFFLTNDI